MRIPHARSQLAVEVTQAIGAVFLVEMDDDFGVAVGGEPMAARLQLRAQLHILKISPLKTIQRVPSSLPMG